MPSGWAHERIDPVAVRPERRSARLERARRERKRRRRNNTRMAILAVLIVGVVFGVFLVSKFVHTWFGDYSGEGKGDVVIQVHDGDSTTAIGQTLQDNHVVS